jgi:1,4-alpha-glucan branching enzyme
MIHLLASQKILKSQNTYLRQLHEDNKLIAFERGEFLFIFNFHANNSLVDYPVSSYHSAYVLALDTDRKEYGGYDRLTKEQRYVAFKNEYGGNFVKVYIPARTGIVLRGVLKPDTEL